MSNRWGRPRKQGPRSADGRLKPEPSAPAPAVVHRAIEHLPRFAGMRPAAVARRMTGEETRQMRDPSYGTPVGVLSTQGELTKRQVAAASRVAQVYAAFDRLHGRSRSPKGSACLVGGGSEEGGGRKILTDDEIRSRDEAAESGWRSVQRLMRRHPRRKWTVLVSLVVEEKEIDPRYLGEVRWMLNTLASHFGVAAEAA